MTSNLLILNKSKAAKRKAYLARKEKYKLKMREYYEVNKGKIKAQAKARYLKKKAQSEGLTEPADIGMIQSA